MTIEAAYEFLASQEVVVISTASADGLPHAAPSFYALDGRNVVFTTNDNTHTGRNLAANPRAAVAAGDAPDPGQTWSDARGIQIVGNVVSLTGADADTAATALRAAYPHLGDAVTRSHFYRLEPTTVDYIHHGDSGDDEFAVLGVNWVREHF
jgi:uncharacterized protein YhbP (UPF0306 family)